MENLLRQRRDYRQLPTFQWETTAIVKKLSVARLAIFLDYDGTITPLQPHPEDALLGAEMRATIRALSQWVKVSIVSGRNKNNIEELVGLPNLFYVGNHGFDIEGPAGSGIRHEVGVDSIRILEKCFRELQTHLIEIPGVQFEPKRLTVTIHYRLVEENNLHLVFGLVKQVVGKYPRLKITAGKKVLEIRPHVEWDKGRAVLWLAEQWGFIHPQDCLLYIGDDLTDEDAFRILPPHGIGILVGNHDAQTYADYHLQDPAQVKLFLDNLHELREKMLNG